MVVESVSIVRKTTVGTRSGQGNELVAFGLVALSTITLIFRTMLSNEARIGQQRPAFWNSVNRTLIWASESMSGVAISPP